jgi:ectoine hydroxylase-related dioxygenase (phytanoyl-CoA dioxygenase family)
VKEGRNYVQAPDSLLAKLLAARLHLDDCGANNGPLRVVPGSHRFGRLTEPRARDLLEAAAEIECVLSAGDVLLMRPLLLHASSKCAVPGHRRVRHFLCGPESPGYGLQWHHGNS